MKFKSTQTASNMKKAVNKALTEVKSDASATPNNSILSRLRRKSNGSSPIKSQKKNNTSPNSR